MPEKEEGLEMCWYQKSQFVLYHIFRYEKKFKDYEVSRQIIIDGNELPVSTFRKYIGGLQSCPIEVLTQVYQITRHPMICELLEPAGHILVPSDNPDSIKLLPTVDAHVCTAFEKLVDLKRAFERAFEDGLISSSEYSELKTLRGEATDAVNLILSRIAAMVEPARKVRIA